MKLSFKYISIFFVIVFCLFTLSSCNNEETQVTENILYDYEELSKYTDLKEEYYTVFINVESYDEILEQTKEGKTFLLISKPNCPYCQTYTPMVAQYAFENELKIIYYNADKTKTDYYKADYNTKTIIVNENNDYYKLANLLYSNDSNITIEGSDKEFVKLRTVEFETTLPWIYVPRMIMFENGIPVKTCFKSNIQETTEETYSDFVNQMNDNIKVD